MYHLLLAEQVVDKEADASAIAFGDDDEAFVQRAAARLDAEHFVQADDGQVVAAERDHLARHAGDAADLFGFELHRLDDGDERHDVRFAAHRDGLAVDDGEREGQGDEKLRALAREAA